MPVPTAPDLSAAVRHPHDEALSTLDGGGAASLAAVTWTAVHLAAVERVLYPAVLRHRPAARGRVDEQLAVDRRLQHALWLLDRRITGAQAQAQSPVPLLLDRVRSTLEEHAVGERALLGELLETADAAEQQTLADRLAAAAAHAPTRPHPDTHHGGATGGLTFAVEAWADRIRDRFDNRSVPTPHPLRPVPALGKWGAYVTGAARGKAGEDREAEPPPG